MGLKRKKKTNSKQKSTPVKTAPRSGDFTADELKALALQLNALKEVKSKIKTVAKLSEATKEHLGSALYKMCKGSVREKFKSFDGKEIRSYWADMKQILKAEEPEGWASEQTFQLMIQYDQFSMIIFEIEKILKAHQKQQ